MSTLAASGTNLFAGIHLYGFFLSTDNGTSWSNIFTGCDVTSLTVSGQNLFAGLFRNWESGGVLLSTNNGTNWTSAGLTNKVVFALTDNGTNLFAGTYRGGVFRSTDHGTRWSEANNGLTDSTVNAFAVWGTKVFVGTENGVFLSTDNGTRWAAAGLESNSIGVLAISGTNLFAGTGSRFGGRGTGMWRRPLSELVEMWTKPGVRFPNSILLRRIIRIHSIPRR